MGQDLIHGPIGPASIHLCVDMQRLFDVGSPWAIPWLGRVLPRIEAICARHASRTVFTRFIPPQRASEAPGAWQTYYRRWSELTLDHIGPEAVALVPALRRFAPPAPLIDKAVYSPWLDPALDRHLAGAADTLVITGGETDVCVLATALGAVDRGYRVILVSDALCSSQDQTHDDLLALYRNRFSLQIEVAATEEILSSWAG